MSVTYGLMLFGSAAFGCIIGIFIAGLMQMASKRPSGEKDGCPYKVEPNW